MTNRASAASMQVQGKKSTAESKWQAARTQARGLPPHSTAPQSSTHLSSHHQRHKKASRYKRHSSNICSAARPQCHPNAQQCKLSKQTQQAVPRPDKTQRRGQPLPTKGQRPKADIWLCTTLSSTCQNGPSGPSGQRAKSTACSSCKCSKAVQRYGQAYTLGLCYRPPMWHPQEKHGSTLAKARTQHKRCRCRAAHKPADCLDKACTTPRASNPNMTSQPSASTGGDI
jgi:hypothetical protein